MCITPSFVWVERGPKWEQQPVGCKSCWRCKENRVNDYVGRAMAEVSTSQCSATVTLTYAPRDDLADKVLTPHHFQLFIKQLRNAGHLVRYLVAGEYGELKARAHFHAILFFKHVAPSSTGEIPGFNTIDAPFCREIPQKRICHIREWPHGHIKCDWSSDEASARYVCKYLLADNKNNAWFSLSKKPPLGAAWFAKKAELARTHGVLPSSFEYRPPNSASEKVFLMSGATRRDYLNAITVDASRRSAMSEWVQKSFDKYQKARWLDEINSQPPEVFFAALRERLSFSESETDKVIRAQMWNDLRHEFFMKDWVFPPGLWIKAGKEWAYVSSEKAGVWDCYYPDNG